MERTESTVVQVSPTFENDKIQEMQRFGWNMQGRQEIHEEGEAYGRPSFISDSTYVVKTTVKHYVKLHFVRSLNLPNLERIKKIEAEYSALPFPAPPPLGWPIGLAIFFSFGIVMTLSFATDFGGVVLFGGFLALCVWWASKRMTARSRAQETCSASAGRARTLLAEAESGV